eukprot:jgi/Bigna1/69852/fgenesh1_pg.10_\
MSTIDFDEADMENEHLQKYSEEKLAECAEQVLENNPELFKTQENDLKLCRLLAHEHGAHDGFVLNASKYNGMNYYFGKRIDKSDAFDETIGVLPPELDLFAKLNYTLCPLTKRRRLSDIGHHGVNKRKRELAKNTLLAKRAKRKIDSDSKNVVFDLPKSDSPNSPSWLVKHREHCPCEGNFAQCCDNPANYPSSKNHAPATPATPWFTPTSPVYRPTYYPEPSFTSDFSDSPNR